MAARPITRSWKCIWRRSWPASRIALTADVIEHDRFFRKIYRNIGTLQHIAPACFRPELPAAENQNMNVAVITPHQLAELCRSGRRIDLIDVRTPVEYREVHLEFARNVPLDRLDAAALTGQRRASPDEPLYVICRSGSRGQQACEKLLKAGCSNVFNVEGGTLACAAAGLPVVRGRKAVSLERQVRIAAGSLVLLGAILAWLVHPA